MRRLRGSEAGPPARSSARATAGAPHEALVGREHEVVRHVERQLRREERAGTSFPWEGRGHRSAAGKAGEPPSHPLDGTAPRGGPRSAFNSPARPPLRAAWRSFRRVFCPKTLHGASAPTAPPNLPASETGATPKRAQALLPGAQRDAPAIPSGSPARGAGAFLRSVRLSGVRPTGRRITNNPSQQ